jgi:signal transduction histidine kinase
VALAALAALAIHWVNLLWRHERTGISAREHALHLAAERQAGSLGRESQPPPLGRIPGASDLEVVPMDQAGAKVGAVRLYPRFGHLGVRARSEVVSELRDRERRRTVMIVGEGALALLMLGILLVMLWRLLLVERQRRREIEEFILSVSHELKSPLAGIKALLGTIQLGYIPEDRLPEYLEMGLREADRLEHLVENLLMANRIRRRLLEVDMGPVDLETFLGDFRRHREKVLPERSGGFSLDEAGARGIWVMADLDKLRVVLENLTDNALKYCPDGEVRIVVEPSDQWVAIQVEDQGVGFRADEAEALFEGHRQSPSTSGALVHGTGLGLGIARHLARAMGGDVTARSDGPGKGSRFSVRLARTAAPAGGTSGPSPGTKPTGSVERPGVVIEGSKP